MTGDDLVGAGSEWWIDALALTMLAQALFAALVMTACGVMVAYMAWRSLRRERRR